MVTAGIVGQKLVNILINSRKQVNIQPCENQIKELRGVLQSRFIVCMIHPTLGE